MVFHVTTTVVLPTSFLVCIHAALWHINNNDTSASAVVALPSENYTQKREKPKWPAVVVKPRPYIQ